MRKSLAILVALILVLALSACTVNMGGGANEADRDALASVPNSAPQSTPSKDDQPANSTTSQSAKDLLTRDRAIELALQEAGFKRENVRDLDAELDRERGGVIWEVDFEAAGYEYSYDINAETGAVVKHDRDRED